jgi:hypothetical protein
VLCGSFPFVYSGSFFNHLPAALLALCSARAITTGQQGRAGLWAGAAFACEASVLLLIAVWSVQVLVQRERALHFFLGLLPGALLVAIHNALTTGSPIVFPNAHNVNYDALHTGYGFLQWEPAALLGLTISPYRGLLFYAPALIAACWYVLRRRASLRTGVLLTDPFVLPALITIALFLTHATWNGGWAYGPRYLTVAALLLLFRSLPALVADRNGRWVLMGCSAFGLLCTVAAKCTTGYSLPSDILNPTYEMVLPAVMEGRFTNNQWPALMGLSPFASTILFFIVLGTVLVSFIRMDRSIAQPT